MVRYIALVAAVVFIAGSLALSCKGLGTGGLTKEKFITIQSEVGCTQATKGFIAAAGVYEKHGVTAEELEKFIDSLSAEEQVEVSQKIGMRMAKCFQGKSD